MNLAAFTSLLRQAKTRRRVYWYQVAEAAGVERNSIAAIREGRSIPKLATARAIATFLDSPALYDRLVAIRTIECERCGIAFVADGPITGGRRRRFCTAYCSSRQRFEAKKARTTREALNAIEVVEGDNKRLRMAVADFCRACSGDGCRTPSCELRAVSPVPLIVEVVA